MRKLGSTTLTGASGHQYVFDVYPLQTRFKPAPGVFLISRRQLEASGEFSHKPLYVGQSADLSRGVDDHQDATCFFGGTANCKNVLKEPNEARRLSIKADLLSGLKPSWNPGNAGQERRGAGSGNLVQPS